MIFVDACVAATTLACAGVAITTDDPELRWLARRCAVVCAVSVFIVVLIS